MDHPNIVYWGYHFESNAEAMKEWLTLHATWDDRNKKWVLDEDDQTPSKVYLIRDRARIKLNLDAAVSNVATVTWLVHNGRDRGYIAPYDASQTNPFYRTNIYAEGYTGLKDGYTTVITPTGGTPVRISKVLLNQYANSGRYSLYDDTVSPAVNRDGEFTASNTYQYVFDDINDLVGEVDNRLKIILKVKYNDSTTPWADDPTNKTKYLVVLLKNDNGQIHPVRNETYQINIHDVGATGYRTLKDAVNGTEYANAAVEVDRTIVGISDANYLLRIALEESTTTSVVYNSKGEKKIYFEFLNVGDQTPVSDAHASDFEIKWEANENQWNPTNAGFEQNNHVSWDSEKQKWYVTVDLQQLGESGLPVKDYLIIRHKASDLTRYVHIYAITHFNISNPEFELVSGTQFEEKNVYHLSFTLPDVYGEDLYPINVQFATSTLDAYSDATSGARHGTFGVDVGSTNVPGITSSNIPTDWNYKATTWDYWYVYSIPSMPTDGKVDIYFKDARSYKAQTNPTSVGLFLTIPYFGDMMSYSKDAN